LIGPSSVYFDTAVALNAADRAVPSDDLCKIVHVGEPRSEECQGTQRHLKKYCWKLQPPV